MIESIINSLSTTLNKIGMDNNIITQYMTEIRDTDNPDYKWPDLKNGRCFVYTFNNDFLKFQFNDEIDKTVKRSDLNITFDSSPLIRKISVSFFDEKDDFIINFELDEKFDIVDYSTKTNRKLLLYCRDIVREQMEDERSQNVVKELKRMQQHFDSDNFILNDIFEQIQKNHLSNNRCSEILKQHNGVDFSLTSLEKRFFIDFTDKVNIEAEFSIETNLFKFPNIDKISSSSVRKDFIIHFNGSGHITRVQYIERPSNPRFSAQIGGHCLRKLNFCLDCNFDFRSLKFTELMNNQRTEINILDYGLPLDQTLLYLPFKLSKDITIKELLPELTIPSAYNFQTTDFYKRFEVAQMIVF